MLWHDRPRLLIHERCVVVIVVGVEPLEFELFGIANPVIRPEVSICMAVRQAVHVRGFRVGFGILSPRGHSVNVKKHVDD